MNPFDNTNRPPDFPSPPVYPHRLTDWPTNLSDLRELPIRDPEFGLTYLRRREESDSQPGIEQFLRFASQATAFDSSLNADNEYDNRIRLAERGWPYVPADQYDPNATLAQPLSHPNLWTAELDTDNISVEERNARESFRGSIMDWGLDSEEDVGLGDEVENEFEVMNWTGDDDGEDDDDHLREAMMHLAQSAHNNNNTLGYDEPTSLDSASAAPRIRRTPHLSSQHATAINEQLRRTYGLDSTEAPWASNYYDYVGSHPLNPPSGLSPSQHQAGPSVTPPSMFDLLEERGKTRTRPTDPDSAKSWTSFLAPGMVLSGSQVFIANSSPSTLSASQRMHRSNAQSGSEAANAASDYIARVSALRAAYAPPPPRTSASATIPLVPPPPDPAADTADTATAAATSTPASSSTIDRLREFGRRPPAFESLLAVLREDVRDPSRPERFADFASRINLDVGALASAALDDPPAKPERWSVEVTILGYDAAARRLSGLMHALGLAGHAEPPTVSTHLQGEILSPGTDGLWNPASARVLPLTDWGIKRAAQAGRHWASIGPFKGVSREELTAKAADLKWLRRKTEGWVLMRWKETGFVNVGPEDSALSIAGFYHCALDRRTGAIDGLYFDPVALPYQTLSLAPKRSEQVAYSHEEFAFR